MARALWKGDANKFAVIRDSARATGVLHLGHSNGKDGSLVSIPAGMEGMRSGAIPGSATDSFVADWSSR